MTASILTVTEPRYYTHMTTALGLKALSEDRGLPFHCVDLEDFKARRWPRADAPLIVLHAAHIKIARTTISAIKDFWPGSKVVTLGSDFIYYVRKYPDHHHGLLVDPRGYEFIRPEDCDLHLDLLQECVDALKGVCPADRWYWTASGEGLRIADEVAKEDLPPPNRRRVVCYANPNVSAPGGYRPRLTWEMARRGWSIQWGGTTEFVTLDENVLRSIYRTYRLCGVCLGTSSPSWTPCRTQKGWRDWHSPVLGLPLVYDDIPEMMDFPSPSCIDKAPVEVFPYEDWDALAALLCKYDDEAYREGVVSKQRAWSLEHTVERQFARIFRQYGLLPEGGRDGA